VADCGCEDGHFAGISALFLNKAAGEVSKITAVEEVFGGS
jgi:hypothetical protein